MNYDETLNDHLAFSLMGHLEVNGETSKVFTLEYNDILNYIRFDELLQKLADKDVDYETKKNTLRKYLNTKNIYLWYITNNSLIPIIPKVSKPLEEVLPFNNKEYTPHIKAYLRWLDHSSNLKRKVVSEDAINNEELLLKALIDELQSEATERDVKKAVKAFHRSNRNLKKYVKDLIAYKANLLLIRLDLAYNKDYIDKNRDLLDQQLIKALDVSTDENVSTHAEQNEAKTHYQKRLELEYTMLQSDLKSIKNYRAKFFRAIKMKYAIEGFIWKLEYGGDKSFHYHCLLMLDGDKHREDISIAMDMGEMWKRLLVNDDGKATKGIYWNCNAHKEHYRHLAIGQLNASDTTMIDNLFKHVLPYLAKTDYYIKLAKTNDRTIGMGNDKEKIKSGRPRKAKVQKIS